jgi:hypothetical protein
MLVTRPATHEQFLEARLVLERPVGLDLIVGQRFLEPFGLAPLILDGLVECAQRVFDALHGPDGIVGVDMRGIGSCTPDEQVRHGCSGIVPAENLESPETRPQPRRIIVARLLGLDAPQKLDIRGLYRSGGDETSAVRMARQAAYESLSLEDQAKLFELYERMSKNASKPAVLVLEAAVHGSDSGGTNPDTESERERDASGRR